MLLLFGLPAEANPKFPCQAELLPGVVVFLGADPSSNSVRAATAFQITLYFSALGAMPPSFKRDLLVSLGDADIARIPLDLSGLRPGDAATRTLELYVPRDTHPGPAELRVGFLRDGAPGEMKREDWTCRRARALTLEVLPAAPPATPSPSERDALLASRPLSDRPNILLNGSFDGGWKGWRGDADILEGRGGWNRVLSESLDSQTVVEPPFALRLDFKGGQDPNYYGLACDVNVRPGTDYTLSYCVRTENLTSGGLPCLDVMDAERPIGYFYALPSPEQRVKGTTPWTVTSLAFTTPPETRKLRIKVRRHGSGPSDYQPDRWGPISGTVWFDAIRLVEGRS